MKKLLLTTAFMGASALPALAQDADVFRPAPDELEIRASDFMGMRVYASEAAVEGEEFEGLQEGWEDIGEINDLVLDREGMVQAVLVDIGGFLGIGERRVAISMGAIQFLSDSATAEDADDFFLVVNANRETLEGAPEYTEAVNAEMTAEQAADETGEAIEEGATDMAAAGAAAGAAVEGAADATGDAVADTAEATENAVEETGEEIADAGAEVADEAADAGEEVAEEAGQVGMTDVQEDQAEVADAQTDAVEETAEETAQATDEAADEAADQTEMAAEGTATETEMEADQTAEAATDEAVATDEMAATDEAVATDEAATEDMASAEGTEMTAEEMAAAEQTSAEDASAFTREGYVAATTEDFTADRLQGAAVFDVNDERVGEVGEILLSESGEVTDLVIDVGGFLGIGEKPVALAMASVDILRSEAGEEIRVYVSQTEEELDAMERYEVQ